MISFVVPALNERAAVVDTVKACFSVASEQRWPDVEVIVIDDGSTDGTGELAKAAGARVIRHPVPGGYGRALKEGVEAARHDTIVTLDADGTYPIERTPDLLASYRRGFDMVVGRRTGKAYRQSVLKMPLRIVLRFMVEFTTGRAIPDINSGFRIFSREAVRPYFVRLSNTFSFSTSMTLAYMMTGRFVDYIDIPYYERVGQSKVMLFRDGLRTIQFIVQAILYFNPLKIFLLMDLLCLVGAAIFMLLAYATQLLVFFLLAIGTLLVSILVFAIGLLAVQLKEIIRHH
jgi:glycosyltransferase involved in cell wall biosynthesis